MLLAKFSAILLIFIEKNVVNVSMSMLTTDVLIVMK